ncbi:MAG: DUF2339 domain-containing protein [Gammaproteobacteria bacterium]|nr:DUF2339 domain-containing protein [Gammaproteobacteria bacterium]MDH3857379.1 DUF2339 domain-containing protein [Gammaproteobacteria bacterium]
MDFFSLIIPSVVLLWVGLPVAVIVLLWITRSKTNRLQQQIDALRHQVADLQIQTAQGPEAHSETVDEPAADEKVEIEERLEPETTQVPPEIEVPQEPLPAAAAAMAPAAASPAHDTGTRARNPVDQFEDFLRRIGNAVASYFTDGNIFVRIGILVLFFGVAFLLKYAAENSRIPLEFRFMGAAFGGLVLLLLGWRLRLSKTIYALLLQGGGIGVIYITIFAAFRLADLLPPALTFALLVFFSAFAVALAILQDSKALAIYAVLGGFLAPFLASTGSGNYIGLFSYYSVLNAAVFAVAWFRAWRSLNLLGFIFTFGVFVLWVAFDYRTEHLLPTSAFLLLFFLMYSLIGVLYALRQPEHMTGLVDGTLVFGTPVIVSGLMMVMLREYDYGIAGASAGMGFYYILLARYAWRHVGEDFRMLAEAMLAIGVVFATLAIPYALDGHWSSAAWALEAAGILWVSIRQNRFYAQCFAIALQVGSGILFFLRNIDDVGNMAWFNPAFLGGIFIALGAFISARMLYLQAPGFKLRLLHIPFYIWAMAWWLISALVQIDEYAHHEVSAWLLLFGATAALLVYLDRLREWNWRPAAINAALLLPVLLLIALYSLFDNGRILTTPDLYFWIAVLATNYWIIEKLETVAWPSWVNIAAHTGLIVFTSLILSVELVWLFENRLDVPGQGYYAVFAVVPLIAMRVAQTEIFPAIKRLGVTLQLSMIGTLSGLLLLWNLIINLTNSGDPAPLPYVPFINPVDLTHIVFFVLVLGSLKLVKPPMKLQRDHIVIILAGLCFIWLTAVLIRSMHHYLDIRFDLSAMSVDTRVQSAISILWTLIGMGAMLFASRRQLRPLWIVGAGLVGAVLIKMFFVDFGASGTVERIVSFLVVGSLLVATGYFSPIPHRTSEPDREYKESSHA